jgi:dCMP deaminase
MPHRRSIMERIDKRNYYLDICETVLERGTCLRRNFAAIIVKNDEIIATGYTGAPRGRKNCCDLGYCKREELNVPRGTRYELCRSVHAEQNAIISARRQDMISSVLYLVGREVKDNTYVENAMPCLLCKKLIINSGINTIVIRDTRMCYRIVEVQTLIDNDDTLTGDGTY